MNYIPIHTTILPNYNFLSAENSYLKQTIEYKDAVLKEQQTTITKLQSDVQQLSKANMDLLRERDRAASDAAKWQVMQRIIRTQGNDHHLETVQKVVNKEIEIDRARSTRMEQGNRSSA